MSEPDDTQSANPLIRLIPRTGKPGVFVNERGRARWRGVHPIACSRALVCGAAPLKVISATHCPSTSATYRRLGPPSRALCR